MSFRTSAALRRWLLALGCAAALMPAHSRVRAAQPPTFKAGIDLVNVAVTVTDRKGALVGDLTADDFEILEDGQKQAITYFAVGDPAEGPGPAMHLGLLLDVSDSMEEDLPFTKTAAVKFLNALTDAVDVTVVDFDSEVRVARFSQAEFARLIERIRQKKVSGDTAIYDAVGVYLDGASGQRGRKIMLLYTDGGDTRSSMPLNELMELLKASDATVYVIGALEHQP
ncbi:MAG TPA: VWA domain-containing protein, partial [Vicinamibacterales bacterium]